MEMMNSFGNGWKVPQAPVVAAKQLPDYNQFMIDLQRAVAEPVAVARMGRYTICSEGNISAVVGEAKSKKTFLCSALVGGMLSQKGYMGFEAMSGMVLWIDTEQSEAHVHRVARRIHRLAGFDEHDNDNRLWMMALRELDPKVRAGVAFEAIEKLHPRMVVIDGVGDLQYNTNDLEESEAIVTALMRISSQQGCHILSVLHTNPNSTKARGHVGSSLQRKSETVLYVRRQGVASVVEAQFCRNEPFDTFAFEINAEALPVGCPIPVSKADNGMNMACMDILQELGGSSSRSEVIKQLMEHEGISRNAASMRIGRACQSGQVTLRDEELSIAW